MVMSDVEKKALTEKIDNPNRIVKCPRCGNEIIRKEFGNSILVKCSTENCIKGSLRGI